MAIHVEQEVKLQVPQRFDLHTLEAGVNGFVASPIEEQQLNTVYYDSDDLRLVRWGCSLRYRKGHGWTLKLPAGSVSGSLRRVEHTFAHESTKPPPEALELVTAYLRGKPVAPVARLRTKRKSIRLHGSAGEEIAEVVDDDVRVMQDGRVANRFREVEVELLDASSATTLLDLTRWLQDAGAGSLDQTPKAVRALGAPAQLPTELHRPLPTEHSTAGDVICHALASSVEALLRNDAALRLHMDPEIVHKSRVATRRLRSDLRTFMLLLDKRWARALRDRVKWLADELGAVRDEDVLLARLRRDAAQLPEQDSQAADAVIDRFSAQCTAARQQLQRTLREERYVRLLDELVVAVSEPKLAPAAAGRAADILPQLVAEPWKKLCRAVDELGSMPEDNALHEVRIKAKRCRYAAETIAVIVGKEGTRFARRVARLQSLLGDLHDAVVAEARLRPIRGDEDEVFVAGGLAAMEGQAASQARASWRKAWKRASKKSLRFWP